MDYKGALDGHSVMNSGRTRTQGLGYRVEVDRFDRVWAVNSDDRNCMYLDKNHGWIGRI